MHFTPKSPDPLTFIPLAVSLVGVAGDPAGVALLAGLTVGVLASRVTRKVSVVQVSAAIAAGVQDVALKARESASPRKTRRRMKPALPG